ncbi:hypothetical protein [Corynebacterium accolens]|uniref:hypothetical protein n=1 Tax=Corynebacterium accolens TaxID=38284 RepID=UPI002542B23B|nr:hypothetical protein [Corynebacterium accolens]MDK4337271.1 hypothetical protein [Corynebacterium accolens]
MTWFKVDDSFYDHPKFLDVPNASIGLWVKAGAWCGKHLTDGVIPASQVKRFKGTKSQIDALISVGIWEQCESENGAKAYRFHDWNEYQPTRKRVLKEREDGAERQRKSRHQKRQDQQESENVTRDSHVTPSRDSHECHKGVSQRPGPARPDPSFTWGTDSQPSNGDQGTGEQAGEISLNELAAATRRARQAGISDSAIKAGTQEFNRRPTPKGPGLLRTLINDAWQQEQDSHAHTEAKAQRRQAIADCDLCDENGMRDTGNGLTRCNHKPPRKKPPF